MKMLIIEVEQNRLRLPIRIYESYKEASEATGLTTKQIMNICYSKTKRPRFERVYIEEE